MFKFSADFFLLKSNKICDIYLSPGNVLGPALSNMDNLLRLPAGCGEQNMVHFAPNLYILRYLKSVRLEASETERKALEYLRLGQ